MFEVQTNVKLHDTDAAGILFFANYLRLAHAAYEAFMKSIGCGLDYIIRQSDYLVLIAHSEADYQKPLFYGDKVTISLKAENIGHSSFVLGYTFRDRDGDTVARLKTVHVSVARAGGQKIAVPDKIHDGLQSIA